MNRLTRTMKVVLLAMITQKLWQGVDGRYFLAVGKATPVSSRTFFALKERGLIEQDGPMHPFSCAVDFKLTDVGRYEAADLLGKPL